MVSLAVSVDRLGLATCRPELLAQKIACSRQPIFIADLTTYFCAAYGLRRPLRFHDLRKLTPVGPTQALLK